MAASSSTSSSPFGSTGTTQRGRLIISSSRASSATGKTVSSPSPFVPSPCPVSSCCTGCCSGASCWPSGVTGGGASSVLVLGVGDNCWGGWTGDCWGEGGGCCPPVCVSWGESPLPAGLPRIEIVILAGGRGQMMPPYLTGCSGLMMLPYLTWGKGQVILP